MSIPLPECVGQAWTGATGLVVAVSGGPDSVCLARALLVCRPAERPVVLAHLNHQLRGAESDADEAFVVELHRELSVGCAGVHLVRERLDVADLARRERGNLEAVARRERYRWLAEVAQAHGLSLVATGHTMNDQAETVLHRLLRGTGLDGLRGIAARRPLTPGVEVIRPLLGVSRAVVLAYLAGVRQCYRTDSTNTDRRLMRSRIRHELLPLLERDYNPRVMAALDRLAIQAAETSAEEEQSAAALLVRSELPRAGEMVVLDVERLCDGTRRQVRNVLRLIWRREQWPMGEMGHERYERVADLVWADRGAMDLPGRIHVQRRGGVLQLSRAFAR